MHSLLAPCNGCSVMCMHGSEAASVTAEHEGPALPGCAQWSGLQELPSRSLLLQKEGPNPRALLPKLFLTRVRLDAPRSNGAAAAAHWAQLQRDEQELTAERNHRALLSLLPARRACACLTQPGSTQGLACLACPPAAVDAGLSAAAVSAGTQATLRSVTHHARSGAGQQQEVYAQLWRRRIGLTVWVCAAGRAYPAPMQQYSGGVRCRLGIGGKFWSGQPLCRPYLTPRWAVHASDFASLFGGPVVMLQCRVSSRYRIMVT